MEKTKRFLAPKTKNGESGPSHEQVAQAIKAFKKRGGLIEKLPPQPAGKRTWVGNRWGSMYESIFDHA